MSAATAHDNDMTSSWAKLRQVIIGSASETDDAAHLAQTLRLAEPFADPEIHELKLVDFTFPVSSERFLEVVGTTDPDGPMGSWLDKVGGRAGYALSVQHPDPDAVRARCLAAGHRVAIDTVAFGKTVLQLHPKDFGLLLEVDGIDDPDVWFWDEISPGPAADATVSDVVAVEIPVVDPAATAALWAEILAIAPPTSDHELDMTGSTVRFVAATDASDWTIELRRRAADAVVPELPGVSFRLV